MVAEGIGVSVGDLAKVAQGFMFLDAARPPSLMEIPSMFLRGRLDQNLRATDEYHPSSGHFNDQSPFST